MTGKHRFWNKARVAMPAMGLAGAMLLSAPDAEAAVVFDYDIANSPASSVQPLRLADGSDFTSGDSRGFSTEAMHPDQDYSGPALFGGFEAGADPIQVAQTNSNGSIRFSRNQEHFSLNALIMGDAGTASFDANSEVVVAGKLAAGFGGANVRLAFGSGGDYYLSDSTIQSWGSTSSSVTLDAATLQALSFDTYDPSSGLAAGAGSSSPFDPFSDVWDSVGVLINYNYSMANTSRNNLGVEFEQLTVTAVPEPASLALVGAGGLLMLVRRRKG